MSVSKKAERGYVSAIPNPEYLIKSISEQGYSLESAIADLADNSITAGCDSIEILLDTEKSPFQLFICDNGEGMSPTELEQNCKFPSSSPEHVRSAMDLGRFGLGMKAASFSQSRKFTVLSRRKGTDRYHAFTWDVDFIKKTGEWRLIVNSDAEVDSLLQDYIRLVSDQYRPL